MKKRRKGRMLALLLALVMAFTMVPSVNAKATDTSGVVVVGFAGGTVNNETATWNVGGNSVTLTAAGESSAFYWGENQIVLLEPSDVTLQLTGFNPDTMEVYDCTGNATVAVNNNTFSAADWADPDDLVAKTIEIRSKAFSVDFGQAPWTVDVNNTPDDNTDDVTVTPYVQDETIDQADDNNDGIVSIGAYDTIKLTGFDPSTMEVWVVDREDQNDPPFQAELNTISGPSEGDPWEANLASLKENNVHLPNNLRFEVRLKENQGQGGGQGGDVTYNVNFGANSWVINDGQEDKTIYAFIDDGETNTIVANTPMAVTSNTTIKLYGGFDPSTMHVQVTDSADTSGNPFTATLATNVGPDSAPYYEVKIVNPNGGDIPENLTFEVVSGAEQQGSNPGGDVTYNVNFGANSWVINDGQEDKTIYAFVGDGEANTIVANTPMAVTSNTTIKLYGGFDPNTMHVQVTDSADTSGNPFTATLATNVGPNDADYYEVKIVNPNGGGIPENLTFEVMSGAESAGGNPNPPGGSEAIIKISAPKAEHVDAGYTDSVTVDSPLWHGNVTTRYSRQWANLSVSLNSGEAGGERTDTFHGREEELEAENCDLSALERQKIRYVPDENDPTKVDISFHLNWGLDIVGLWVNGEDSLGVFEIAPNSTQTIFHDRNSFLRHYGDQGVTVTLPDVTVPAPSEKYNESDENELPVFEIEVMVQPNTEVFIGNFLWSKEDCFAPAEQGGTEPSDLYIGHSEITLMDVYYDDGSDDDTGKVSLPDYIKAVDNTDAKYKHLVVNPNTKQYTDPVIHAIHYQLDREGMATGAVRKTSEMVMPTGTWVVMKIQPEQGYQVKSFQGVNRNKGNVVLLDDEGTDGACIFAFKIDEGNFHIGANVVPYEDEVDAAAETVTGGAVYLPAGDIDGGTGKLEVSDADLTEGQEDAIGDAAPGYTIDTALDLDLNQTYLKGGVQAEGASPSWDFEIGHETALTKPAEISLTLDETTRDELEGREIQLVHEKANGTCEIVPITSYDPESGEIAFETKSFSNYAIVSKEVGTVGENYITVHADTAALSGGKAIFTYKDEDGVVIGTVEAPATALEAVEGQPGSYKIDRVGAVDFTVKPAEGYTPYASRIANVRLTVEVGSDGTGLYTAEADQSNAYFAFLCNKQYSMSVLHPSLTVGEGDSARTAITTMDPSFEDVFEENDEASPTADDPIFIQNFDPETMAVVIKKYTGDNPSTATYLTTLTPKQTEDSNVYKTKLGILDVAEGETLTFELVEKSPSGGNEPGPVRPEGTEIRFDGAKGIVDGTTAGEFLVVYDGPEGDVTVKVTGESGDRVNKFSDGGTDWQAFSIFTTGDSLNLDFVDGDPVKAEWLDDDGQTAQPVIHTITPDASHKAVVDVPTAENVLRRVDISFGGNPQLPDEVTVVLFADDDNENKRTQISEDWKTITYTLGENESYTFQLVKGNGQSETAYEFNTDEYVPIDENDLTKGYRTGYYTTVAVEDWNSVFVKSNLDLGKMHLRVHAQNAGMRFEPQSEYGYTDSLERLYNGEDTYVFDIFGQPYWPDGTGYVFSGALHIDPLEDNAGYAVFYETDDIDPTTHQPIEKAVNVYPATTGGKLESFDFWDEYGECFHMVFVSNPGKEEALRLEFVDGLPIDGVKYRDSGTDAPWTTFPNDALSAAGDMTVVSRRDTENGGDVEVEIMFAEPKATLLFVPDEDAKAELSEDNTGVIYTKDNEQYSFSFYNTDDTNDAQPYAIELFSNYNADPEWPHDEYGVRVPMSQLDKICVRTNMDSAEMSLELNGGNAGLTAEAGTTGYSRTAMLQTIDPNTDRFEFILHGFPVHNVKVNTNVLDVNGSGDTLSTTASWTLGEKTATATFAGKTITSSSTPVEIRADEPIVLGGDFDPLYMDAYVVEDTNSATKIEAKLRTWRQDENEPFETCLDAFDNKGDESLKLPEDLKFEIRRRQITVHFTAYDGIQENTGHGYELSFVTSSGNNPYWFILGNESAPYNWTQKKLDKIHPDDPDEPDRYEYNTKVYADELDDVFLMTDMRPDEGYVVIWDEEGKSEAIGFETDGNSYISDKFNEIIPTPGFDDYFFEAFEHQEIAAPILKEATKTSISLQTGTKTITNEDGKQETVDETGYEYCLHELTDPGHPWEPDEDTVWSTTGSYTGLKSNTEYIIYRRGTAPNGVKITSEPLFVSTQKDDTKQKVEEFKQIEETGATMQTEVVQKPGVPTMQVTGLTVKQLADVMGDTFTGAELEEIAAEGDDMTLSLEATSLGKTVPAGEKAVADAAIQQMKNNTGLTPQIGAVVDLSLLLTVGDGEPIEISQTASPLRISFEVPAAIRNTNPKIRRTFYFWRFHEGKATLLTSTTGNVLTGSSNLFSTYMIAYVDEDLTPAAPVAKNVTVSYLSHIQNIGWGQGYVSNGTVSGTSGKSYRLEGIKVKVTGDSDLGIQYTTHVQDYGWMGWCANDEMSGTEGESKRLEAIKMQLTGANKDLYDIYYRVHAQNIGWMNWAKNGAAAGTAGYAYRLEAIQIVVVKKGAAVNAKLGDVTSVTSDAYRDKNHGGEPNVSDAAVPNVTYRTHVQNVGWQAWKTNGTFAGTSGRSLRLEGIQMRLSNSDYAGGIRYKTHVQNDGWQDWRANGVMSGTSGRSLRLEAINVELTGEVAKHYDIYYRVHAQNYGWLGWAKNGESAGTSGQSLRLEGIQVVIVPKGSAAPGNTYKDVTADASKKAFYGK